MTRSVYGMAGSRGNCREPSWSDSASWMTLADKRCSDHNRLGFALQLWTDQYLGTFLHDLSDVPWPAVKYLATQLDVAEVSVVKRYVEQLPPSMGPPGKSDRRAVTATCLPRMLLWGCGSSWKAGLDPCRVATLPASIPECCVPWIYGWFSEVPS